MISKKINLTGDNDGGFYYDEQLDNEMFRATLHPSTEDGPAVRILIALVAKDQTSHMDGIVAVSTIFGDDGNVQPILDATTSKEIYDAFVAASQE